MSDLLVVLELLEVLAANQEMVIYNICHRKAGWAIQWHDLKRQGENPDWRKGLYVEKYYPSFQEMVKGEYGRLCPIQ